MPDPLPQLGLDDLRVAEPDRDSEAAFSPSETWAAALAAIERGYAIECVARTLLELDDEEWDALQYERHGATVDAGSPEMQLHRELAALISDSWVPSFSTASVYDLLDERDRLQAAIRGALPIAATFANQMGNYPEIRDSAARVEAILRAALS